MASGTALRRLSPRGVAVARVAGTLLALASLVLGLLVIGGYALGAQEPGHGALMEPAVWLVVGSIVTGMLLVFSPGPWAARFGVGAAALVVVLGVVLRGPGALPWSLATVAPLLLAAGCAAAVPERS